MSLRSITRHAPHGACELKYIYFVILIGSSPNNKAFKARVANEAATSKKSQKNAALRRGKQQSKLFGELGLNADLDWMCYSNPYDFD